MSQRQIIVHYGELSTKGKNKKQFQQKLADQIRYRAKCIPALNVSPQHDYMYVSWSDAPYEEMIRILLDIPGIARFEPVYQVEKDIQSIEQMALDLFQSVNSQTGDTFKVVAKRQDKNFPLDTYAIQRQVGGVIGDAYPEMLVDLKNPDYKLVVSIHAEREAYLSLSSYTGMQGLPYGSSGKGLLMLSGGFDSPIAGYLMMKRGMVIEAVHFASPPYTSPQALEKVRKLTAQLSRYGLPMKLHVVPFAKIQEEIKQYIHDNESMTVMRRMMLRIMDQLLLQYKAQAIVNGESLGQVASQTLQSMAVINEVTNSPVLRPLIATDKNDIIRLAEEIGTYDISNEPYDDCCTVFAPASPHTKPKLKTIEKLEQRINVDDLIQEAVAGIETETIDFTYLQAEKDNFSNLL